MTFEYVWRIISIRTIRNYLYVNFSHLIISNIVEKLDLESLACRRFLYRRFIFPSPHLIFFVIVSVFCLPIFNVFVLIQSELSILRIFIVIRYISQQILGIFTSTPIMAIGSRVVTFIKGFASMWATQKNSVPVQYV